MKVAIIQFPGSNCDQDMYYALKNVLNVSVQFVWHKSGSLGDATAVILPGGFSFGDYLRSGAIACTSPIMKAVAHFAKTGGMVLGVCNGFQILCEMGLLPGALVQNNCQEFRCQNQGLTVCASTSHFSPNILGEHIQLPIAHGLGNYRIPGKLLDEIEANRQVLFRYSGERGNPNGSLNQIAGIRNRAGNVMGMMPHPERAVEPFHTTQDGIQILRAFLNSRMI